MCLVVLADPLAEEIARSLQCQLAAIKGGRHERLEPGTHRLRRKLRAQRFDALLPDPGRLACALARALGTVRGHRATGLVAHRFEVGRCHGGRIKVGSGCRGILCVGDRLLHVTQ